MNTSQKIWEEDLQRLTGQPWLPLEELRGKSVFITGATGLIGTALVSALQYYNEKNSTGIRLLLLVRDLQKARRHFAAPEFKALQFVEGTLEALPELREPVDYIIHGACPTGSAYFVSNPVETVGSILQGTTGILELARAKKVQKMVFLSSMEVYGQISTRELLTEADIGYLDPLNVRNCYPQGKRMAETLCVSYAGEYGVPAVIARLAQSFGPGVTPEDKRVFAYMANCVMNDRDIVLNTDGSKENMYVYTMDAVSAILLLLLRGEAANAYNVANESTYCSVKEMGRTVIDACGKPHLSVITNAAGENTGLYRPDGYLRLSAQKLTQLGWKPQADLPDMYRRMIAAFPG